jgi:hypothetical protein
MCTGAILRAQLEDPQRTVEPFSWGYGQLFGLRFTSENHPLKGALVVSERGEEERGARPVLNAPDRIHVTRGGLDYHGWPDRFGFLWSREFDFVPFGLPADDNPEAVKGQPVQPVLLFRPQSPVAPRVIKASRTGVGGFDFVPMEFAGGGNPGASGQPGAVRPLQDPEATPPAEGDAPIPEEQPEHPDQDNSRFDYNRNGSSPVVRGIQNIHFFTDGGVQTEQFAFNCKVENQITDQNGRRLCRQPADKAFRDQIHGLNSPVDAKFGPDGALYLVDSGVVQDVSHPYPDNPFVQIPATGVIWRISRIRTIE